MRPISFKRHRFPPEIIRHAIWLYARFTLSLRDVEELLAERGIDASYETVRRWFLKFGPSIAANIRRSRPRHALSPAGELAQVKRNLAKAVYAFTHLPRSLHPSQGEGRDGGELSKDLCLTLDSYGYAVIP
jgi:hypothetical protein